MKPGDALRDYWLQVREGTIQPTPRRNRNGEVRRVTGARLDGSFGPDRDKRIVVTLHPDGRLELRPERTRRSETVHLVDCYRWALRCRTEAAARAKRALKKSKRLERLAAARQERFEKRLAPIRNTTD